MKISKKGYIVYSILITVLFTVGTYYKYSIRHEKLPKGCDEFGYLNMAKAISNDIAFQDHAPRPFLEGLIDTLQQEGLKEQEYIWMVVPHAYHLSSTTNWKVINQYPPGTSYVLSWFPLELRQRIFPLLVMLLTLIATLFIGFKYAKLDPSKLLLSVSLIAIMLHMIPPFGGEMLRINSLAFTFGLFIGVGLTAKKHPLIALFCVVLSTNFRVVNLLMLLPLLFFFIPHMWDMLIAKKWKPLLTFIIKSVLVIVLAISPYIYYMLELLGNPLIPTYPVHDTSFGTMTSFYFSLKEEWFLAHLFVVVLLVILNRFKRLNTKELLIWITFPVVNYLLFSFHKIQMSYYPFASFFILVGAVIYYFAKTKIDRLQHKLVVLLPLIIAIVLSVDGVGRFMRKDHVDFNGLAETYRPLCDIDVVWGEQLSSTAEYVCNNNGFKYDFASPKAREIAFNYLLNKNYSQAILCDDVNIDFEDIYQELTAYKIVFQVKNLPEIGRVILIKRKNGF